MRVGPTPRLPSGAYLLSATAWLAIARPIAVANHQSVNAQIEKQLDLRLIECSGPDDDGGG